MNAGTDPALAKLLTFKCELKAIVDTGWWCWLPLDDLTDLDHLDVDVSFELLGSRFEVPVEMT